LVKAYFCSNSGTDVLGFAARHVVSFGLFSIGKGTSKKRLAEVHSHVSDLYLNRHYDEATPMRDQLMKRSAGATQRAIRHYLSEEYDQFLVQAAASFEQLGKARLAALAR
jgi:hypothetical protein